VQHTTEDAFIFKEMLVTLLGVAPMLTVFEQFGQIV